MKLRPEVQEFAEAMEKKLRKKDRAYGNSWKKMGLVSLWNRFDEEIREWERNYDSDELVDIANTAMFVWKKSSSDALPDKPAVYLAGPIFKQTDSQAIDWRETAKKRLEAMGYSILNPMDRDYRDVEQEEEFRRLIVKGDIEDVVNCDIVLANCPQPSIGTAMEIFFAKSTMKKFVVSIVPNPKHVSPWLAFHSDEMVDSLEAALEFLSGRV